MDSDKTSAGAGADGVSTAAGADAVGAALDGASVASVNAASAALDSAGAAGAASTGTGAASDGMPDLAGVAAEVASVASDEDSGSANTQGDNVADAESGEMNMQNSSAGTDDSSSTEMTETGQMSKDYGTPEALDFTGSAAKDLTSTGLTKDDGEDGGAKSKIERPNEPLIPAAPVPGSLGSVVSGPAKGTVVIPEDPQPSKSDFPAEPVAPVFEAEIAPDIPEELRLKLLGIPKPVDELDENDGAAGSTEAVGASGQEHGTVSKQGTAGEQDAVEQPVGERSAADSTIMKTEQEVVTSRLSVVEMPELAGSISEMQLDAAAAKEAASAASRAASAASQAAAAAASAANEVAETVSDAVAAMSGVYLDEKESDNTAAMAGLQGVVDQLAMTQSAVEQLMGGHAGVPATPMVKSDTPSDNVVVSESSAHSMENAVETQTPYNPFMQAEATATTGNIAYNEPMIAGAAADVSRSVSGEQIISETIDNGLTNSDMAVAETENVDMINMGGAGAEIENTNMASAMAPDVLQPKSEVFSAEQPAPETEKKPKQIKKVSITTVILLGIFAAVATALAIIFFIQWQMGVQTPTVNTTPETPGTSTEPDEPIVEQQAVTEWACVAALDTTEMPNLDNLVDGNLSTTLTFDNDWLMVMQAKLTYNFIDESSAVAALPQFQLLTEIANATVNAEGLSPLASSYEMQGNSVIYTVWTDIQQALSAEGLTVDLPRDINGELVLDSETVANYFIGKGQSCWEVSVTEAENQGDMNNSGTETEENTTVDSGENAADGSGVDDGENTNNSSNEINNNTILEDSEN